MISAKNYAAQFERGLLQYPYSQKLTPKEQECLKSLAATVNKSTHFAVPDGGILLNARGSGLVGQVMHLPFKNITVECWSVEHQTKYVAIAFEDEGPGICVTGGRFNPFTKSWDVCLTMSYLSRTIEESGFFTPYAHAMMFPSIRDALKYDDKQCRELSNVYCCLVIELIEALTCRNVVTEPLEVIDEKVNVRRIRDGKLPLYETRILTIKTPEIKHSTGKRCASHASPRQHLRRGHIRRLESGNIWVNSCVVGDANKGVINKQYSVTA